MSVQIYNYPIPLRQRYTFSAYIGSQVDIELMLQVGSAAPYYDPDAVWHIVSQKVWPDGESRAIGGLSVTSDGKITGTATEIGQWIIKLYAVAPYLQGYVTTATKEFSVAVQWVATPPIIEEGQAWTGRYGVYGNWKAKWGDATGNPNNGSISTWGVSGLPLGLEFDAFTGVITGFPEQAGVFPIQITATGPAGSDTKLIPLTIQVGPPKIIVESIEGNAGVALSRSVLVESPQDGPVTSWAVVGAPEGMSIDNAGILTWPDPVSGDFLITISAAGVGGSDSRYFNITILEGGPRIVDGQAFELVAEEEFAREVRHRGSGEWSLISGALPPGVEFSGGYLGGTPTQTGVFSFTVRLYGDLGEDESVIQVSVSPGQVKIVRGQVFYTPPGRAFEFNVQIENETAAPAQSWGATNLPEWAALSSDGKLSGVAPADGYDNIFVAFNATGLNGEDSAIARIIIDWDPALLPSITSALSISSYEGDLFEYAILAERASSFSVFNLAEGWQFNEGVISATPVIGSYNIGLLAENPYGQSYKDLIVNISGRVAPIVTAGAVSGFVEQEVFYRVGVVGVAKQFSATGLPPGVSIDSQTGLISGAATSPGSYSATVYCDNEYGQGSANIAFDIQVPVPVITSVLTGEMKAGVPFYYQIDADNAQRYEAAGLPYGLIINQNTGVISGTPEYLWGDQYIQISAINDYGRDDKTLHLTVAPVIEITSPGFATAIVGQEFSYQITARSDIGGPLTYYAYSYSALTISVDEAGLITGVAEEEGEYFIYLSVEDGAWNYADSYLFVTVISSLPKITSSGQVEATVGQLFEYQITASGAQPIDYSVINLPDGFIFNSSGKITATPNLPGVFQFTVTATNEYGQGSKEISISVAGGLPVITSSATATAVIGQSFSYQITATNSPSSYSAIGLPEGLNLNFETGLIGGALQVEGDFTVTIKAENGAGEGSQQLIVSVIVPIPVITSPPSISGIVGELFNYQITASNSPSAYSASGLPEGVSLDTSTGLISGVFPADSSVITVSATNQYGAGSLNVEISVVVPIPEITSPSAASGVVGVLFNYQIAASNFPASYSAEGLPEGLILDSVTGIISGTLPISGNSNIIVSATNQYGTGSKNVVISFSIGVPQITSLDSLSATIGALFSYEIIATNQPISYEAAGLPVWLKIEGSIISGVPVGAGNYNFTVFANNITGAASKQITLSVAKRNPSEGVLFAANNAPTEMRQIGVWRRALDGEAVLRLYSGGRGLLHPRVFTSLYRDTRLKGVIPGQVGLMNSKNSLPLKANWIAAGGGYSALLVPVDEGAMPFRFLGPPAVFNIVSETINGDSKLSYISAGRVGGMIVRSDDFMIAYGDAFRSDTKWGKVIAVSAGYSHYLSVSIEGRVKAWGSNDFGQTDVPAGLVACNVCAGRDFSLALKSDGSVVSWGKNNYHQIDGTNGLQGVKALASGYDHVLVLKMDGTVAAYGLNDRGQTNVPAGINDVIEVAAGDGFSVALRRDGTAYFWGQKQGVSQSDLNGKFFKKISAGEHHLLALGVDGSAFSFGGPSVPAGSGILPLSSRNLSSDDIAAEDWVVVGGELSAASSLSGAVMKCGIQDGAYFGTKARSGTKVAHLRNVSLPGRVFSGGFVVDGSCSMLNIEFSAEGVERCLGVKFYSRAEFAEYFSLTAASWGNVDWDFTASADGNISIDILGDYVFYAVKAESASLFIMTL